MAEIKNIEALNRKLQTLAAKALKDSGSVVVGFTANYALYVHENLEMKWKGLPRGAGLKRDGGVVTFTARSLARMLSEGVSTGGMRGFYWDPQGRGQSKFLEQPARELAGDLAEIIKGLMQKGKTMMQSLLVAGLRLQRQAQLLVPVDTGNLKASAFTRIEK